MLRLSPEAFLDRGCNDQCTPSAGTLLEYLNSVNSLKFKANISKKPAESCGIPVISRLKTHSLTAHVPTIQLLEELPSYALPQEIWSRYGRRCVLYSFRGGGSHPAKMTTSQWTTGFVGKIFTTKPGFFYLNMGFAINLESQPVIIWR